MSKTLSRNVLATAVVVATSLVAGQAAALEEVRVTAQKRSQSLQDVPVAIAALTQDDIQSMGLQNVVDIGLSSPSLQTPAYPLTNNNIALFIRGIGNADSIVLTKDPTVGLYYDGVYAARSTGLLADLSDLERVEILRGPQGTLYGRNNTAGAVNFINRKPTGEFGLEQTLSYGNYSAWRSVTHLDLPSTGGLKAKLTATFSDRDGWVENQAPANDTSGNYNDYYEKQTEGYRVALRHDGSDNLTVDYSFDYSDVQSTPAYFQYGGPVGGLSASFMPITNTYAERLEDAMSPFGAGLGSYYLPESDTEVQGHNLTISYDISDTLTLKSITGYREFEDDTSQNFAESFGDAGTLAVNTVTDHEQFSQEIQLIGTHERVNYVAGIYYFEEEGNQRENQFLDRAAVDAGILAFDFVTNAPCSDGRDGAPVCTDFFNATLPNFLGEYTIDTEVESLAVFGQVTYTPNVLEDNLDLTFGLRYTDDEREAQRSFDAWPFNLFADGASDSSKDKVDYTFIADYSWSDDVSTYIKVATGFRSGGSSRNGADFSQTFDNEDLMSYELGWKTELADGRVRLNGAIFSMMIDDIILDYLPDPVNTPQVVEVFNSGEAEITGFEIDAEATVTENLYVGFNFAYLDYDFDDVIFPDGSDQTDTTELVWAPEYALAIRADYNVPVSVGELRMHVDYSWQDDQFALANTNFGEVIVGDYGLLNARIGLADVKLAGGDWQFAIWGKNITDEDSANYQIGSTAATYLQPATYGIEARLALD